MISRVFYVYEGPTKHEVPRALQGLNLSLFGDPTVDTVVLHTHQAADKVTKIKNQTSKITSKVFDIQISSSNKAGKL